MPEQGQDNTVNSYNPATAKLNLERRAEAAEARVADLERGLRLIANYAVHHDGTKDERGPVAIARDALKGDKANEAT